MQVPTLPSFTCGSTRFVLWERQQWEISSRHFVDVGNPDWDKKTSHCLRQFSITKLANDPRRTQVEVANAACHKSVNSQKPYTRSTAATSETPRTSVLGGERLPTTKPVLLISPYVTPIDLGACDAFALVAGSTATCAGDSDCEIKKADMSVAPGTALRENLLLLREVKLFQRGRRGKRCLCRRSTGRLDGGKEID
jgi:hypothetical protein